MTGFRKSFPQPLSGCGAKKLSESDVKEAMREVRLALLEADVNYKVAKDFTQKVTEELLALR